MPMNRILHDVTRRGFASDNHSGVHPRIIEALVAANGGHQPAYGADVYTEALRQTVREQFGEQAQIYPVFNGTGANVVSLDLMCQRWDAVICARTAHINTDECAAPERMAALKLQPVDTPDGRLTPDLVDTQAWGYDFIHHAQPTVLSITQSTELGTLYSVDELGALVEHAHSKGIRVHLDGARLANAAAALDVPLRALTTDVGVDVVSLGGTKVGCMGAEAVVVLNPDAVSRPEFIRKLNGQLASKMRFTSVQLLTLLQDDLWRETASHANSMARKLYAAVKDIPGVQVTRTPQANAVFAILDPAVTRALQQEYSFYIWDEATGEVRWMCSFDTTDDDIAGFASALRRLTAD